MFLEFERELWPASWHSLPFSDPVVPLEGALYGVSRAGYSWGWRARKELVGAGFSWIRDIGEDSIYYRPADDPGAPGTMVVLYSDDFALAGPEKHARDTHQLLDKLFGFSKKGGTDPELKEFVSIHRTVLPPDESGARRCQLSQGEYIDAIVARYCREAGVKNVRHFVTPLPLREEGTADDYVKEIRKSHGVELANKVKDLLKSFSITQALDEDAPDVTLLEKEGRFKRTAGEHIGGLLWVVRGTRPDAYTAAQLLSTRIQKWTAYEDRILERVFGYLAFTRDLCLQQVVHPGDFERLLIVTHVDADHGGDLFSTKSRSGWCVALEGMRSHALLGWCVKQQTATGKSTGDCEVTAISDCISTNAESTRCCVEQVLGRPCWLVLRSDADAAIGAIHKGYSRKLSYLRRTQKVSIGYLHDFVGDEHTALVKVHTDSNDADLLTKSLEKMKHWRHTHALGLRARE